MFKTRRIREKLSQEKEEHGSTRKKKTMKENEKRKTQKENQFGLQLATPTFEKMSELVTSRACGQEPLKSQIRREKIHIHWIRIVKTVFFLDCSFIFGVSICKTFVTFTDLLFSSFTPPPFGSNFNIL